MNIQFLKGKQADYDILVKQPYTFYYTEDTHRLYLGDVLLANQTVAMGDISAVFKGEKATISSSFTPAGNISTIEHTPEGEVEIIAIENAVSTNYTPAGTINTPAVNVTPTTINISTIESNGVLPTATFEAGTLPSATLEAGALASLDFNPGQFPVYEFDPGALAAFEATIGEGAELILNWNSGKLPTLTKTEEGQLPSIVWNPGSAPKLVWTPGKLPSLIFNAGALPTLVNTTVVTDVSAVLANELAFIGSGVYLQGGFTGHAFTIAPTFTGSAGTATAEYTPAGSIDIKFIEPLAD